MGTFVMTILLIFRVQFFSLFRQESLADDATSFFSIRAPFIPLEYLYNLIFFI